MPGEMKGDAPPAIAVRQMQAFACRLGQLCQQMVKLARDCLDGGQRCGYPVRLSAVRQRKECDGERLPGSYRQAFAKGAASQDAGEGLIVQRRLAGPFEPQYRTGQGDVIWS